MRKVTENFSFTEFDGVEMYINIEGRHIADIRAITVEQQDDKVTGYILPGEFKDFKAFEEDYRNHTFEIFLRNELGEVCLLRYVRDVEKYELLPGHKYLTFRFTAKEVIDII
jgi:hypothetical protein